MNTILPRIAKYFSYLFVLMLALAGVASAQTADQVLRLWVGYNTLLNSKTLEPAVKSEVETLNRKAIAENGAGNYGAAMDDYYHAIALMRGEPWSASRAASLALSVDLNNALLEPNTSVEIRVKENYTPSLIPDGPLAGVVSLVDQNGSQVGVLGTLAKINPDLKTHPVTVTAVTPITPDGNYKVHLLLTPRQGDPITKDVEVHIEKGLLGRAIELRDQMNGLNKKLQAAHEDHLVDALQTIKYHDELLNLANSQKLSLARINFDGEIKESEDELKSVEAGRDPFASRRGDFRRAYLSKVDNTLQPYRLYVPTTYDGSKPYPLIIALHGMGGDENTWFDLYGNGLFKTLAEKHGYIVACPKGRGPASMYRGAAEQDVLDVLSEIKFNYKIDLDRIYLTGHSMGGFGTWSIAIDHPDLFAALAPISGGGDPKSISKIAHIPELVTHGDNDKTVPVQRSREMVDAARKAGAEVKFDEVPGGSHVSVAVPAFKPIFEFFDSHRKTEQVNAKAGGATKK